MGGRIAVQTARTIVKAGVYHVHIWVASASNEPIALMPGEFVALAHPLSSPAYVVTPLQKTENTVITEEERHRHFIEALFAAYLNPELTTEQLEAVKEMFWKHHKAFSLNGRLCNTNL
ncbi:uncharacterized protein VTP21DRAFT_5973 [Calcarisporiella thermophila]|uniref:uncharacterized protein n=1 Tax=Calcarisporiella thermophila TaxID=911321 RepID=UPI0037432AEF